MLDPLEKKAYIADAVAGFREVTGQIASSDGRVVFTLDQIFSDEDLF